MPENEVADHVQSLRSVLAELPAEQINGVGRQLLACYQSGGTVFLLGNGGSAATASHFACDLTKGTRNHAVPRFRVVALTDNVSLMTAWGNDSSYDRIFAEQLNPLVRPGDVVLAISASGNSPNVLEAMREARDAGATTIAWTGPSGGAVAGLADTVIRVPAETIEGVEDGHLVIAHALTRFLRARLAEQGSAVGDE
jgi:D-sedoheptulose 7-phosphate isomerase